MSDTKFIDGLYFNLPHEKAPDFVRGSLGIHRDKLIDWLSKQAVNEKGYTDKIDLKVSKEGKAYAQVSDFKPEKKESASGEFVDSDIPF